MGFILSLPYRHIMCSVHIYPPITYLLFPASTFFVCTCGSMSPARTADKGEGKWGREGKKCYSRLKLPMGETTHLVLRPQFPIYKVRSKKRAIW